MAVTTDREVQRKKLWKQEIKKRKDFGISDEVFLFNKFSGKLCYCSLKYLRDFELLDCLYIGRIHFYKEKRFLISHNFRSYIKYTFGQVKDAGGALQLSKVCQFIHIIVKNRLEYKNLKLAIYYRDKNAINSNRYPQQVKDVFKNDSKCKAVAFLYKEQITRYVLIEKYQ